MRRIAIASLLLALTGFPAGAGTSGPCTDWLSERPDLHAPRPLRFGVTAAGQVTSTARERVPDKPEATIAAMRDLAGETPFTARITRVLFRDGEAAIERAEELAARYTGAGFEVTLQLRYGQIPVDNSEFFPGWVREVVARVGDDPGVVAVEVTNEANLTTAPDASDGGSPGALDALVGGVVAAAEERDARGFDHLTVGFTWFHGTRLDEEGAWWDALAAAGGSRFAAALDWVGLNAYPGTYGTTRVPPGLEGREMRDALAKLRRCYLPRIGAAVPIRVTENGYPDGLARQEIQMDIALEGMVRAVHEVAGAYDVTHYAWFTLRDVNSGSVDPQARYGLLRDTYVPKSAFALYRSLVAELGA